MRYKAGFFEQVYRLVRQVPRGKVVTYGQIAAALGSRDARRVGWAMHANRDKNTPCHRVVNKDGRLAPNFAFDGEAEQRRRLEAESVRFIKDGRVEMVKYQYEIDCRFGQPRGKVSK